MIHADFAENHAPDVIAYFSQARRHACSTPATGW